MPNGNTRRVVKIGNGARELDHFMVRTGRQVEPDDRLFEKLQTIIGQRTVLFDITAGHLCICRESRFCETFLLTGACPFDAAPDGLTVLT